MSGTDLVFNVMIEVDEYLLHVPVRQYEQGTEFGYGFEWRKYSENYC